MLFFFSSLEELYSSPQYDSGSVINIVRFDQMLFSVNEDNFDDKWISWNNTLDSVPFYYFKDHVGMDMNPDSLKHYILTFIDFPEVLQYKLAIDHEFKDLKAIEITFNKVFDRYKEFLPNIMVPKSIITLPFHGLVDTYKGNLLVGLNNYLSEADPHFYSIYQYQRYRSDRRFLIMDGMEYWFTNAFLDHNQDRDKTFLDHLIFKGKIMYLMNKCYPSADLSDIMRYSQEDMDWCESNEFNIWNEVIGINIMYDYNYDNFRTFFNPAPFTNRMPEESPGRLGYWIGYKIISSYMKNNQITIPQLLLNVESQRIFLESEYKPDNDHRFEDDVSIFIKYWWFIFALLFVLCIMYLYYLKK